MSFGLPSSSGFCYSQISNLRDENVPPQPQNGGLMTAQDCQNLAKYIEHNREILLKPTIAMQMGYVRPWKWPSGWLIAIGPWIDISNQLLRILPPTCKLWIEREQERFQWGIWKSTSYNTSKKGIDQYQQYVIKWFSCQSNTRYFHLLRGIQS